jgi:peptidoglycan/LPS O-acetylase OafA/YrhL
MSATGKPKFAAIEAGRGIAAVLVVFHHAGNIMREPRFYGMEPFGGHFRNFNVGVDFFFVLSGFIITWVHWRDIGQPGRIVDYARKRVLRIFPPYWGILFPLILLYLIFPAAGKPSQHDPLNILLSIVLLPNTVQPVLGVAWTLTHEIFFYFLFAGIIATGFRGMLIMPLWALAIIVGHLAGPLPFPLSFLLSPFNIEFIMGVGAAWILRRWTVPAPRLVMSVGIAAFLAFMLFAIHIQGDLLVGRLAFGVPSLLFVLGSVEAERHKPFALPTIFAVLGAASYVIYLVHPVLLSFGAQLAFRIVGHGLPLDVIALVMVTIGVVGGLIYHHTIERWLTNLMRHILAPKAGHPTSLDRARPVEDR